MLRKCMPDDVVSLYPSPSENVLVLCVDEKSQVWAPARTQPMRPMGPGYAEGLTTTSAAYGRQGEGIASGRMKEPP